MDPTASHPRDESEGAPAQGFQSEDGEHVRFAPPAPATPTGSGAAAAHQHEDDELVLSID